MIREVFPERCRHCDLPVFKEVRSECPKCTSENVKIDPDKSEGGYYIWNCLECGFKWCS